MRALRQTNTPSPSRSRGQRQPPGRTAARRDSDHYDRKLDEILRRAAVLFCTRGYHQASIRDISRVTKISVAGLYYYFSSKEELLYLIQRHAFQTLLTAARTTLASLDQPEQRLRAFIRLHLQYFLDHPSEMRVLTHEEEWVGDERRREIRAIKKAYYRLCFDQVEALKRSCHPIPRLNTRLAVLSLFGMMNWIYTWYNPKIDPDAQTCADQMADLFYQGLLGCRSASEREERSAAQAGSANGARSDGIPKTPRTVSSDFTRRAGTQRANLCLEREAIWLRRHRLQQRER